MNDNERIQLDKMIKESGAKDFTKEIRKKKHSQYIKRDVNVLLKIMKDNPKLKINNPTEFENKLIENCQFLFNYYTDIFNRLRKEELDIDILWQLVDVLEKIEKEEYDQHVGSVEVGKILKKIYIDSALRKANKLNKDHEDDNTVFKEPKNITWAEFKKMKH
jgi:hypothetical protein